MANLSQLTIPVKNPSTGVVTTQTFGISGSGGNSKNFEGPRQEWDAKTEAQKDEFDTLDIYEEFYDYPLDDELSDTSENPVQNKVITEEINGISDEISDMNNVLGAKNILPNNGITQTINGVTFTVNPSGYPEGSVKATWSTSPSSTTYFDLTGKITLKKGSYILTGCPSGGGANSYGIQIAGISGGDWGSGKHYTLEEDVSKRVYIVIFAGATASDLVFYPMLRPDSVADDTYVPYAMTNRELTVPTAWVSVENSYGICRYRKIGNAVEVFVNAKFQSAGNNTWHEVVTLPDGYRPPYNYYQCPYSNTNTGAFINTAIYATGVVYVMANNATSSSFYRYSV